MSDQLREFWTPLLVLERKHREYPMLELIPGDLLRHEPDGSWTKVGPDGPEIGGFVDLDWRVFPEIVPVVTIGNLVVQAPPIERAAREDKTPLPSPVPNHPQAQRQPPERPWWWDDPWGYVLAL